MKKLLKIIIKLGLLVAFGLLCYSNGVAQTVARIPKIQDPELLAMADELRINVQDLNLFYTNSLTTSWAVAEYSPNTKSVFIRPRLIDSEGGLERELVKGSLAHEYMHYIWDKYKNSPYLNSDDLKAELSKIKTDNQLVKDKAVNYINDEKIGEFSHDEAFAFSCTGLSDETLASYSTILKTCKIYIDRSKLPAQYLN